MSRRREREVREGKRERMVAGVRSRDDEGRKVVL